MIDLAALAPQFQEYENRWIAIDGEQNKIIAAADSINEVDEKATTRVASSILCKRSPVVLLAADLSAAVGAVGTVEKRQLCFSTVSTARLLLLLVR